jgi:hypothetical protein
MASSSRSCRRPVLQKCPIKKEVDESVGREMLRKKFLLALESKIKYFLSWYKVCIYYFVTLITHMDEVAGCYDIGVCAVAHTFDIESI